MYFITFGQLGDKNHHNNHNNEQQRRKMMKQTIHKCTRIHTVLTTQTYRCHSNITGIDFTQKPSQFMKTLEERYTMTTPTTTTSTITANADTYMKQQETQQHLYQIMSINSHLNTRNESLLRQLNEMMHVANMEPEEQERAMKRFKKIVSADPRRPETDEEDPIVPLHLRDPMQGIIKREELLRRFEVLQSIFESVTETTALQGFHMANAPLLQLDSPLISLLSNIKYHNYPPIYTLDIYLTRVINAFQLGEYERAEQSCHQLLKQVKDLTALVDRAVHLQKRREALKTAEFKPSGKFPQGSEEVEAALEELRNRYYTVPTRWNVYGVQYPEFDPILGIEENNDLIYENIKSYEMQAYIALMEIYSISNQVEKAEEFLTKRMEDPTLENTLTNALDVSNMGALRARQGRFEEAIVLLAKGVKQLLAFPRVGSLRSVYEIMLLLCEEKLKRRNTAEDILMLHDRLMTGSRTAAEEGDDAEIKQYIRLVLVDTLLSRNNSRAHKYIDDMLMQRGVPRDRVVSSDYAHILKRRAEALAIDRRDTNRIIQLYEHAVKISILQTGEFGYKLPLIYDSYANYCEQIGDSNSANALRAKRDSVLQHNACPSIESLKTQEQFSFLLLGISIPNSYSLLPTGQGDICGTRTGIDSLQHLNQLKSNVFEILK